MKQGILVVSFGTSYPQSRKADIESIEQAVEEHFPGIEVRRAFTSRRIIRKLKERDGLVIDNPEEALLRAAEDGIRDLAVQPTHMMDGFEYMDLVKLLEAHQTQFDHLVLGRPLLSSDADYQAVVQAVTEAAGCYDDGETAICLMGHGTEAGANQVYEAFQKELRKAGFENYYIGTVEAEPSVKHVAAAVQSAGKYKRVVLKPFMVVAGDHANRDMAGEEEDSWKSIFQAEGYPVECILEGLGQLPAIQEIYTAHAREAARLAGIQSF